MNKIELYQQINRLINKAGFDARRFPGRNYRMLLKYLRENRINSCFDVGANTGQYAQFLRGLDFKGTIRSFEPQSAAFIKLEQHAVKDADWEAYHLALGAEVKKSVINISKNSVSSSILAVQDFLTESVPETAVVDREEISVETIDHFRKKKGLADKFFLKIDAQGFESKILEGAEASLPDIYALELELSCVSLYKEEKLLDEMKPWVESKGFYLSSLENGFIDPQSGRLLQVEAIFLREI